jgi:hypothetical protein
MNDSMTDVATITWVRPLPFSTCAAIPGQPMPGLHISIYSSNRSNN